MFRIEKILRNRAKTFMDITRRPKSFNVAILGASRPLGKSVSLLMKQNPFVECLSAFDYPDDTFGVAMDLSHIPTEPMILGCIRKMKAALPGSALVLVTGGKPKKRGQTDIDLFKENADFIIAAMREIAVHCPYAFVVISTEPINYVVPLASKVLKSCSAYSRSRLFGVTAHDTLRAQMLVSDLYNIPPDNIKIPVICGHSSSTIVPLFSHIMPKINIGKLTASTITEDVRAIDNVVATFAGQSGKSTLSAAYATYCTASVILNAMNGYAVEHAAFIANDDYHTKFFASPIIITRNGISATMQFKAKTALEKDQISKSLVHLRQEVRFGESYYKVVKNQNNKKIPAKSELNTRFSKNC